MKWVILIGVVIGLEKIEKSDFFQNWRAVAMSGAAKRYTASLTPFFLTPLHLNGVAVGI